MKYLISLIPLTFLAFILVQCNTVSDNFDNNSSYTNKTSNDKQKGLHLFGAIDSTNLEQFAKNNFDWITLVTWSYQIDIDSPNLIFARGDSLERLRKDSMWASQIRLVHDAGFKVFFKPHIWIREPSEGKWRSDISTTNEQDWQQWKTDYRDFILFYARIAQKNEVELFCIGTELSRLSVEKTDYWKSLIKEVRSIYTGKLTYAANWYREYEQINFWDQLDYIGIQAYFPLVKNEYPTIEQLSNGWKKHLRTIESIHKKHKRKILFTEMGYKSTANAAIKPWEWIEKSPEQNRIFSTETQANCYQSFFDVVWKKDWMAGVHIWQLRSDFVAGRGRNNLDFTPQGKPAEIIIAKEFE